MINGTNSLVNGVMGGARQIEPEVGMGATVLHWTDRSPATIVAVHRNKSGAVTGVSIQGDVATVIKGGEHNGSAEYTYAANPEAPITRYTVRQNGAFVREGSGAKNGERIAIGRRERYYDPSF
jgi:hypothetical protein